MAQPTRIPPARLALVTLLGFASGLPLALSGFTLRMWLTSAHIGLGTIGLTADIGLAYSLKFLWAPVFDELPPPWPLRRLGRRRGWLLTAQLLLAPCIAALAFTDPGGGVGPTLLAGACLAFLSASQDILIDAWRIERFAPRQQGAALAGYVWGYRAALLISGAGVIAWSAEIGWRRAILAMAGLALLGPLATLVASEPAAPKPAAPKPAAPKPAAPEPAASGPAASGQPAAGFAGRFATRFAAAVAAPLREFLSRPGAMRIIAFIILFRLGEASAGVMLPPYYTWLGFDRAAIAVANGPISLAATLAGAATGGWLVARLGVGRALLLSGAFQTAALLMYPALGLFPHQPHMLVATSALEAFAEGFADAAFLTYLSGLCSPAFTATQYALLSSLAPLAMRTLGGASGFLAAATGFIPFFVLSAIAALPAMALMLLILRYNPPAEGQGSASFCERKEAEKL